MAAEQLVPLSATAAETTRTQQGDLRRRWPDEQIAFGEAVKLAVTSFCVAAVGAATAGTALVAGTFA